VKIWMILALIASTLGTHARAEDLSSLDITANTSSTSSYVQLLITDPTGRQTGLQFASGPNIQNIPGSSYFPESIDNEETGEAGTQIVRFGMNPVASGNYTIILIGLANRSYSMNIDGNDSNGNPTNFTSTVFTGYLGAGTSQQFVLPFNSAPGAANKITKTVTFDLLRQEVHTAFLLSEIGDKKFAEELEDLLAQGQKALDRKDRDDRDHHHDGDDGHGKQKAIDALRQFISQVDQAAKEKSNQDHDRDHDRDHKRFATSTAAQSLTSDAKTLIQQLEGQPGKDHDHHGQDNEGH